ncbi:LysR substrate-binding domain-containing protein, partial [Streptomyces nigra]|uniref:LysR substrate-binding domain-containing protein n=1 Tax=Streptomyces nigra TaxID=1827580 RepID=UPI003422EF15
CRSTRSATAPIPGNAQRARLLPRYLAEPALAAGRVVRLHRSDAPPLNTLYLAVRRGAPANPALTVVREQLTDAATAWGAL